MLHRLPPPTRVHLIPQASPKTWQEDTDRWKVNVAHGSKHNEIFDLPTKDVVVKAWGGNDHIINSLIGNDLLDGGKGFDTVYYTGERSDFQIINNKDGSQYVIDKRTQAIDKLKSIEKIVFSEYRTLIEEIRGY